MGYRLTPEQRAKYNERARLRAAEKALAAGRTPGRKGQPPKNRTAEENAELHRERTRRYYFENHEKMKKYRREWARDDAAEKAIEAGRMPGVSGPARKYATDEEFLAAKAAIRRKYYAENSKKLSAQSSDRQKRKRKAVKAGTHTPSTRKKLTLDEKRAKINAAAESRRATVMMAGGSYSVDDLRVVRYRQNGICPCCNHLLGSFNLHTDHWIPLSKGGSNDIGNIRLTHGLCNLQKGARHPDTLRQPYEVHAA